MRAISRQKASNFPEDLAIGHSIDYDGNEEQMQYYYKADPVGVFTVQIFIIVV